MVLTLRPVVLLDLEQAVDVPGIEDERLLADRVGAGAQREADMGVVQIIGRADRDIVDRSRLPPAQLVDMAVEALELGEEGAVGEIAVDDADGVAGIERGDQPVAGSP